MNEISNIFLASVRDGKVEELVGMSSNPAHEYKRPWPVKTRVCPSLIETNQSFLMFTVCFF